MWNTGVGGAECVTSNGVKRWSSYGGVWLFPGVRSTASLITFEMNTNSNSILIIVRG